MIEIIMPKSGLTMEEGTLVEWLVKVGDTVKKGDIIATIETDKSTLDIEAPASGIIDKILVEKDETVAVGIPIAMLQEE